MVTGAGSDSDYANSSSDGSAIQQSIVEFIESRLSTSTDLYAEAMRELERYLFTRVLETTVAINRVLPRYLASHVAKFAIASRRSTFNLIAP